MLMTQAVMAWIRVIAVYLMVVELVRNGYEFNIDRGI